MEVIVLGCGPSSALPALRCLVSGRDCRVCREAFADPNSKNRRSNPSVLVRAFLPDQKPVNVLIDCGKTFREQVLRVFPGHKLNAIDAVVLTHGHADACLGMDDLREVQRMLTVTDPVTKETIKTSMGALPLFCSAETQKEVARKFDYLVRKTSSQSASTQSVVLSNAPSTTAHARPPSPPIRWTAQVDVICFKPLQPFEVCGLKCMPLPVLHGNDYIAYGFELGFEVGFRFVYISDISAFTRETEAYLDETCSSNGPIDVLMIDALWTTGHHATHMSQEDVMVVVRKYRPKRTFFTGMSHQFNYYTTNNDLRQLQETEKIFVQMAYDGLVVPFTKESAENSSE